MTLNEQKALLVEQGHALVGDVRDGSKMIKHVGGVDRYLTSEEQTQREAEEAQDVTDAATRVIMQKIESLEAEVTQRRLRDSVLTSDGKTWLTNKEAEIATQRAKL